MPFIESLNLYIEKIRQQPNVLGSEFTSLFEELRGCSAMVDLGCGNGHFLQAYLQNHPELRGVGVERRFKRVFKTAQKVTDTEARVIQGDVIEFLEKCPAELFDEVWMQFPDPWPKLRHAKHRMLNELTFEKIFRVIKNNGVFRFRSDCFEYWENLQNYQNRSRLFQVTRAQQGDLFSDEPQTLFQRKFLAKQIPIYSLEFRKVI